MRKHVGLVVASALSALLLSLSLAGCGTNSSVGSSVVTSSDGTGVEIDISDDDNPLGTGVALSSSQLSQLEKKIFALTNDSRESGSRADLKKSSKLNKSSKVRATELKRKWSHTRPNGTKWLTALASSGVKVKKVSSGENLAYLATYARTEYTEADLDRYAETICESLINSPSHKKNIMAKKFKYAGIRAYQTIESNRLTLYVCEHFCSSK